jgi:protein arginine N-methyltransferase 1
MVKEARKMLAMNPNGHKVEVVHADAFEYLPPEPVDVVICEMIHVGMLREKQVEVIESFKRRYLARFGGPLPIFLPEAVIMAVQPLQQEYDFEGFYAPIVQFQETTVIYPGHHGTGPAGGVQHHRLQPAERHPDRLGRPVPGREGRHAERHALHHQEHPGRGGGSSTTIDWLNHYMMLPLANPVEVRAGDVLQVSFQYRAAARSRRCKRRCAPMWCTKPPVHRTADRMTCPAYA